MTPEQLAAFEVLVEGGTNVQAAEKAGVSRVTVWRWLRDEDNPVCQALAQVRAYSHDEAKKKVAGIVLPALDVLISIALNPKAQDKDRIAAAREILSRGGLAETTRSEVQVDAKDAARDSIVAMLAGGELDDDALDALAGDDDTEG